MRILRLIVLAISFMLLSSCAYYAPYPTYPVYGPAVQLNYRYNQHPYYRGYSRPIYPHNYRPYRRY